MPHKFAVLWVWDLPVGRGKRFGADINPWLDGVIGGWQFSGGGRMQIPLFRLANTQFVGMSQQDVQKLFNDVRIDDDPVTGLTTVWNMPADIVSRTPGLRRTDTTQPGATRRSRRPGTLLRCRPPAPTA